MSLETAHALAAEASHVVGRDELFEGWERCFTDPEPDPHGLRSFQSIPLAAPVPYSGWDRMYSSGMFLDSFRQQEQYCLAYAWAVTCPEALEALVALGPLVEIGAGTGWWAMRITETGGNVVAYDTEPYDNHWSAGRWAEVSEGGPEKAAWHADRAMFLCWPPYTSPMAAQAVRMHRDFGGTTVAIIGEGPGGCTGDDDLCAQLDEHYVLVAEIDIPQWEGLHDYLTIWRRPLALPSPPAVPE